MHSLLMYSSAMAQVSSTFLVVALLRMAINASVNSPAYYGFGILHGCCKLLSTQCQSLGGGDKIKGTGGSYILICFRGCRTEAEEGRHGEKVTN